MSAGDDSSRRGTAAVVVATAAITLAVGVTVAAFGGYLGPRAQAKVEPAATSAPPVVLVPVTNQPAAEQPQALPPADEALPTFVEYRRAAHEEGEDDDEFERAREHHRRHHHEHERGDDDD